MKQIIIKKGVIGVIDAPEKPIHGSGEIGINYLLDKYQEALKAAMKTFVLFKDQDRSWYFRSVCKTENCTESTCKCELEEGDIYPIPEGYKVEFEEFCTPINGYPSCYCEENKINKFDCFRHNKVAILTPVKGEGKDIFAKVHAVEKEETQEELTSLIKNRSLDFSSSGLSHFDSEWLAIGIIDKFTLIRKK
jgi:hypothetical protein